MDHEDFTSHYVSLASSDGLERAAAMLARDGLVTFDGVHDRRSVVDLASRLLTTWEHRDAGADGVTMIADRGSVADRLGYAGFGTRELHPHTDASALARPPRLVMLVCIQPAESGGESCVVDGAAVYADLAARAPGFLQRLRRPGTVRFGDPGYWGSVFEPTVDGRVTVRLRLDGLEHFTEPVDEAVPVLRAVISRYERDLPLRPGQGYVLDNWRMLHGRREFRGSRLMYRVLGDPVSAWVLPSGFVPGSLAVVGASTDAWDRP
ncbi:Taurine dioxygenase, alpha-ketoglutarate-dependent [Nonomuraea solani]|uniref:Taurine dioxygenase, alpha-ketoglutarate-dependent n=1 Tax=Nonomuraea solani TaxID=1144553 RepID=A0A1H6EYA2_9ACTN|nr:TauD/TfdA family dioxygenase [Nonomuraea solani]SEH02393.1 Taurine dioxygenase, alpha-ketoglutarate-dependent [Nonomuraea solani]